jgi:cell division protease FtsH
MNTTSKTVVFWLVVVAAGTLLWFSVKKNQTTPSSPEISYSQFLSQVHSGAVSKVRISGNVIEGTYREGGGFRANTPTDQGALVQELRSKDVEIWYERNGGNSTGSWLMNLVPLLLLALLWFFMIRTMRARRNPQSPVSPGT